MHKLKDGSTAQIRPIQPSDVPLMEVFHRSLSMETVSKRYFAALPLKTRISPQRLQQVCREASDNGIALVAERGRETERQIIGVLRLTRIDNRQADLALVISDAWQDQHLGPAMLREAILLARDAGVQSITANALSANGQMAHIAKAAGAWVRFDYDGREYEIRLRVRTSMRRFQRLENRPFPFV